MTKVSSPKNLNDSDDGLSEEVDIPNLSREMDEEVTRITTLRLKENNYAPSKFHHMLQVHTCISSPKNSTNGASNDMLILQQYKKNTQFTGPGSYKLSQKMQRSLTP